MKNLLAAVLLFASAHAHAQQLTPDPEMARIMQFSNDNYDFGRIPSGKPEEYAVKIRNVSADSVRIESVRVSCGCTTPKWSKGPYAPGETFDIIVGFNGESVGPFTREMTVFFSGGLTKRLKFRGEGIKESSVPRTGGR